MYATLPLVANLRCGLWYAPRFDATCYFKSTDGHNGWWNFSTTRLNMALADLAAGAGGAVVVDATRKGKRFPVRRRAGRGQARGRKRSTPAAPGRRGRGGWPWGRRSAVADARSPPPSPPQDSLSKTIPIWACVLNRAVARVRAHDARREEQRRRSFGAEGIGGGVLVVDTQTSISVAAPAGTGGSSGGGGGGASDGSGGGNGSGSASSSVCSGGAAGGPQPERQANGCCNGGGAGAHAKRPEQPAPEDEGREQQQPDQQQRRPRHPQQQVPEQQQQQQQQQPAEEGEGEAAPAKQLRLRPCGVANSVGPGPRPHADAASGSSSHSAARGGGGASSAGRQQQSPQQQQAGGQHPGRYGMAPLSPQLSLDEWMGIEPADGPSPRWGRAAAARPRRRSNSHSGGGNGGPAAAPGARRRGLSPAAVSALPPPAALQPAWGGSDEGWESVGGSSCGGAASPPACAAQPAGGAAAAPLGEDASGMDTVKCVFDQLAAGHPGGENVTLSCGSGSEPEGCTPRLGRRRSGSAFAEAAGAGDTHCGGGSGDGSGSGASSATVVELRRGGRCSSSGFEFPSPDELARCCCDGAGSAGAGRSSAGARSARDARSSASGGSSDGGGGGAAAPEGGPPDMPLVVLNGTAHEPEVAASILDIWRSADLEELGDLPPIADFEPARVLVAPPPSPADAPAPLGPGPLGGARPRWAGASSGARRHVGASGAEPGAWAAAAAAPPAIDCFEDADFHPALQHPCGDGDSDDGTCARLAPPLHHVAPHRHAHRHAPAAQQQRAGAGRQQQQQLKAHCTGAPAPPRPAHGAAAVQDPCGHQDAEPPCEWDTDL
jgi:hypothetical protein